MHLRELRIERINYGEQEGSFKAVVELGSGLDDRVAMVLPTEFGEWLLPHVAGKIDEFMAESAKDFGNRLRAACERSLLTAGEDS